MPFRLKVEDGRHVQTLEVDKGRFTVGRAPTNGLAIESPGLAPEHASFRQVGERVEVKDLGSRVGVRLRGERVRTALLVAGETVQLGWARITVVDVAEPDPASAAAAAQAHAAHGLPHHEQHADFRVLARRTVRVLPWWGISAAVHAAVISLALLIPYTVRQQADEPDAPFTVTLRSAPPEIEYEPPVVEPNRAVVPMARPDMSVPLSVDTPLVAPDGSASGQGGIATTRPRDDTGLVFDEPGRGAPWAQARGSTSIGVGALGRASGSIGEGLDASFGKDDAGRANAAAAGRLTGEPFTRALVDGLRLRTDESNVKVVRGDYDQGENVMEALGLRHGFITAAELEQAPPAPEVRAIFWNCTGRRPSPEALGRLADWVEKGGFLFTSDWGIELVLEKGFPGYLRPLRTGSRTVMTPDETITFTVAPGTHALLAGLPPEQEKSRWWLEDSSIPFEVVDKQAVEVLVVSSDLERRHGSKFVAATFRHGKGRVVHVLGHMFQKEGNLRGAYAMQRLLLNFLYAALRGR